MQQEDFLRSVSQRVGGGEQDPSVGSGTQTRGHEGPRPTTEKQPHTAGPRNLIGPAPQTKDLHAGSARESSICEACC